MAAMERGDRGLRRRTDRARPRRRLCGRVRRPSRAGHADRAWRGDHDGAHHHRDRSEEHTSELQSLMRISYAVFCLKKKKHKIPTTLILIRYQQTLITERKRRIYNNTSSIH